MYLGKLLDKLSLTLNLYISELGQGRWSIARKEMGKNFLEYETGGD